MKSSIGVIATIKKSRIDLHQSLTLEKPLFPVYPRPSHMEAEQKDAHWTQVFSNVFSDAE